VNRLNEAGKKTLLFVVGDDIPENHRLNKHIVSFGFINKNLAGGEAQLIGLLKESSFLLLPTRADCTPVAFSEANSYALPVISTDVGGIPSVVTEKNGRSFEIEDFIDEAIAFILNTSPGTTSYSELCLNSYRHYREKLSWIQVQNKFKEILQELSLPVNSSAVN